MSESGTGSRLGWVVLEAMLVVFGLAGAWLISEWQAGRSEREGAEAARAAIAAEIAGNRSRIAAARDYHTEIFAKLQPALSETGAEPTDLHSVFSGGFVAPAEAYTVAWEAARTTGILAAFEQSELLEYAGIYEELERYREASSDVGAVIYGALFESGTAGVFRNWRGILPLSSALLYQECGILAGMDRVLAGIGEGVSAPEASEAPDAPDAPGPAMCVRLLTR